MPNRICIVPSLKEKWGNLQRSTKRSTRNLKEGFLSSFPTIKPWNLLQEGEGWREKGKQKQQAPLWPLSIFLAPTLLLPSSSSSASSFPPAKLAITLPSLLKCGTQACQWHVKDSKYNLARLCFENLQKLVKKTAAFRKLWEVSHYRLKKGPNGSFPSVSGRWLVFLPKSSWLSSAVHNDVGNHTLPCSMLILGLAFNFCSETGNRFSSKMKGPLWFWLLNSTSV